jgi:hypothetical protein
MPAQGWDARGVGCARVGCASYICGVGCGSSPLEPADVVLRCSGHVGRSYLRLARLLARHRAPPRARMPSTAVLALVVSALFSAAQTHSTETPA